MEDSRGQPNAYKTLARGASHKHGYTVEKRTLRGDDVSEKLARMLRCNRIALCMRNVNSPSRSQRRGVMAL